MMFHVVSYHMSNRFDQMMRRILMADGVLLVVRLSDVSLHVQHVQYELSRLPRQQLQNHYHRKDHLLVLMVMLDLVQIR